MRLPASRTQAFGGKNPRALRLSTLPGAFLRRRQYIRRMLRLVAAAKCLSSEERLMGTPLVLRENGLRQTTLWSRIIHRKAALPFLGLPTQEAVPLAGMTGARRATSRQLVVRQPGLMMVGNHHHGTLERSALVEMHLSHCGGGPRSRPRLRCEGVVNPAVGREARRGPRRHDRRGYPGMRGSRDGVANPRL